MKKQEFIPKLFTLVGEGVSKRQIVLDMQAGVIVGIIALPLAIAFAIASGVSPEKGILTAIVAGFLISLLGGSRVQIGGPTGAFIVIVSSILTTYGYEGLLISTFLAGILLVGMGLLRFGSLLKFIPQTLITGFTTGIAVIIATTQIKDFFGLQIDAMPESFSLKWVALISGLPTLNPWATGIGVVTVTLTAFLPRIAPRVPWTLAALVLTSAAVVLFDLPVETIHSRFGVLPSTFPGITFFSLDLDVIRRLFAPAFSIAILGALESLLSAVVADSMIGGRHRSNMELVAQGVANIVSPLIGGIPATGAIARTAANIKNGGRTPVAGMVHALTLLVIFLVAMPVIQYVPLAAPAGILIVVAWHMSEVKNFISTCKINTYEMFVLMTTFLLTIFIDLTVAIPVGFILAVILFMKRMSDSVEINPLLFLKNGEIDLFKQELGDYPENVIIFELNGPLFFGSVFSFLNIETNIREKHTVVILRFRYVPIIDTTGLSRLKGIAHDLRAKDIRLIISGANDRVVAKMLKYGAVHEEEIASDIREALRKATA